MNSSYLVRSNAILALMMLSLTAHAESEKLSQKQPNQTKVETVLLQSGTGYELKELTYLSSESLRQQSSILFFIHSAQGAKNASEEAGLAISERDNVVAEFNHSNCAKDDADCLNSSASLIVIDKGLSERLNDSASQFSNYISNRGLQSVQQQQIKQMSQGVSLSSLSDLNTFYPCNDVTVADKDIAKSLDFPFKDSRSSPAGSANINSEIDANFHVDADARIFYEFASKMCVPYRVTLKKVDTQAHYKITGDIDVTGGISGDINTIDWHSYTGNIGMGVFNIGPIPVEYSLHLPIEAGIGNIHYQASGELGLKKHLQVSGDFSFECTMSDCRQLSASYDDNGLFNPDNIKYQALASADFTPYIGITIDANLYGGLLWAKAGSRAELPIKVIGYVGNTCGNGNGLDQNDNVMAGLVNVDLNVNAYAKGNHFEDQNWPIVNRNLFFADLIKPSSALSPLIRPNINGQNVNLSVGVRSCVSELPSFYQNYQVDWGDGQMDKISNMNGGENMSHHY
ncbi:MAG: hypothetical protein HAW66_05325, partial [Shewanella sp.]|nr:hypothetical protein [Shewanella sp.]